MPPCALVYAASFRIGGSLNYVESHASVTEMESDIVQSIDYTIHFEKYTLPLSTVVLKLPISNSDFTASIINFIISKFTHV